MLKTVILHQSSSLNNNSNNNSNHYNQQHHQDDIDGNESGETTTDCSSETESLSCSASVETGSSVETISTPGKSKHLLSESILSAKLIRKSIQSWKGKKFFSEYALSSSIDPTVAMFMQMSTSNMIARYARLNPRADKGLLQKYVEYCPRFFRWAGADLFPVTTEYGEHKMVVLETNSCPSGQKYMPLVSAEANPMGGYKVLLDEFLRVVREEKDDDSGGLAVVFDKNVPEVTGYADTLSSISGEEVFLVECYLGDEDPPLKFVDEVMYVRDSADVWHKIRAAFRYVTQKPWTRIPLHTKTLIFNPIQACLAGGRNKMLAAKAYEMLNEELRTLKAGVEIQVPETTLGVHKKDVPKCVSGLGGFAVIKDPYSNCGQGVYTITNPEELSAFMSESHTYDSFIVQNLIGNPLWSSKTVNDGKMCHRGTVPDAHGDIYAFDLRMLCYSDSAHGFRPLGMYSRRARTPLSERLDDAESSWEMLGTNLSCVSATAQTGWISDTERVSYMDIKNFASLGLGLDDLITGFFQTVLCTVAIDKLACKLTNPDGTFNFDMFQELNDDPILMSEITY